jgi:hypothetical protein
MHGARAGAPRGNKNALKHGEYSAENIAFMREMRALAKAARESLATLDDP